MHNPTAVQCEAAVGGSARLYGCACVCARVCASACVCVCVCVCAVEAEAQCVAIVSATRAHDGRTGGYDVHQLAVVEWELAFVEGFRNGENLAYKRSHACKRTHVRAKQTHSRAHTQTQTHRRARTHVHTHTCTHPAIFAQAAVGPSRQKILQCLTLDWLTRTHGAAAGV